MKYKWVKDPDGFVPDFKGNTKVSSAHYQIKFYVMPGKKLYEATVLYDLIKNEVIVDFGVISHVNKYGDQGLIHLCRNFVFVMTKFECYFVWCKYR